MGSAKSQSRLLRKSPESMSTRITSLEVAAKSGSSVQSLARSWGTYYPEDERHSSSLTRKTMKLWGVTCWEWWGIDLSVMGWIEIKRPAKRPPSLQSQMKTSKTFIDRSMFHRYGNKQDFIGTLHKRCHVGAVGPFFDQGRHGEAMKEPRKRLFCLE